MKLLRTQPGITLIVIMALLLSACASDSDVATGAGDNPSDGVVETRIGCEFGPYFPLSTLDTAPPLLEDSEVPEVAEAIAPFLESGEGDFWPQEGWRVLEVVPEELVQLVNPGTDAAPQLAFMSATWEGDGWRWGGSSIPGDCTLVFEQSANTGSLLEWQLDPTGDHGPESTMVSVIATELACTGATPVGDRLRDPIVTLTGSEVRILLTANPLEGEQTCPGNPSQDIIIELDEAIGERVIVDGRTTDLGELSGILNQLIDSERS